VSWVGFDEEEDRRVDREDLHALWLEEQDARDRDKPARRLEEDE
jgi:hypothetical protein